MRSSVRNALVFGAVALTPALALAASDAEQGHDWFMLGLQALNLVILGFVLVRYARKPMSDFFQQRAREVGQKIEEAQQALADAERELAGVRERLAAIETEKAQFVGQAEDNARAEAQRHVERANEMSVRIQEDARRVANQEIARARAELRADAAALATRLAGDMLRDKVTPDDDRRLVSEFVDRVGTDS